MDFKEAVPVTSFPEWAKGRINLADRRLGAAVVEASDQFFAPAERMISPDPARFYPERYDDHGKWMDGWESRRKRTTGHDWCVLRLAMPGILSGADIDTSFFTGNYPPGAMLEACFCDGGDPDAQTQWTPVLGPVSLGPDAHHLHPIDSDKQWTHVRLNILPDGGVARLRLYGRAVRPDMSAESRVNLAALEFGARVVAYNDSHYGDPNKILSPVPGENMGDGWETRRRREPGNDWCIIELAAPGTVEEIEVNTAFFKGNFPDRCSVQAAFVDSFTDDSLVTQSMFWPELLSQQPLSADAVHSFGAELAPLGVVSHLRLNIYPDGGISRFRVHGHLKTHR